MYRELRSGIATQPKRSVVYFLLCAREIDIDLRQGRIKIPDARRRPRPLPASETGGRGKKSTGKRRRCVRFDDFCLLMSILYCVGGGAGRNRRIPSVLRSDSERRIAWWFAFLVVGGVWSGLAFVSVARHCIRSETPEETGRKLSACFRYYLVAHQKSESSIESPARSDRKRQYCSSLRLE